MQIFSDKIGDHRIFKFLPDIQNMVFESQFLSHTFRFEQRIDAATSLFFLHASPGYIVESTVSYAYQFVSLL